jgi:hypothetical protein
LNPGAGVFYAPVLSDVRALLLSITGEFMLEKAFNLSSFSLA